MQTYSVSREQCHQPQEKTKILEQVAKLEELRENSLKEQEILKIQDQLQSTNICSDSTISSSEFQDEKSAYTNFELISQEFIPDIECKSADGNPESKLCDIQDRGDNSYANVFSPERKNTSSHNIVICGHRGAGSYEPENTMKAFQRAMDMRLTSVEFDVSRFSFNA